MYYLRIVCSSNCNGLFRLLNMESDTDTDKMASVELCGNVHSQLRTEMFPLGAVHILSVSVSLSMQT